MIKITITQDDNGRISIEKDEDFDFYQTYALLSVVVAKLFDHISEEIDSSDEDEDENKQKIN